MNGSKFVRWTKDSKLSKYYLSYFFVVDKLLVLDKTMTKDIYTAQYESQNIGIIDKVNLPNKV